MHWPDITPILSAKRSNATKFQWNIIGNRHKNPVLRYDKYTGLQILRQLAEFRQSGADFDHSWDQCKSVEKKNWGGGVRGLKIDFFDLETMFLAFFRCGRLHYKWEKFLTCYNSFPAFLLAQSGHVGPVFTFYKMAGVWFLWCCGNIFIKSRSVTDSICTNYSAFYS